VAYLLHILCLRLQIVGIHFVNQLYSCSNVPEIWTSCTVEPEQAQAKEGEYYGDMQAYTRRTQSTPKVLASEPTQIDTANTLIQCLGSLARYQARRDGGHPQCRHIDYLFSSPHSNSQALPRQLDCHDLLVAQCL